jgi:exopolysaccharide biosynthesis polyprenyl glycosylphosphotransferase
MTSHDLGVPQAAAPPSVGSAPAGAQRIVARPASTGRTSGYPAFLTWAPLVGDAICLLIATFAVQFVRFGSDGGGKVDIGIDIVDYRVFSLIVVGCWLTAILLVASGRVRTSPVGGDLRTVLVATEITFLGTAVAALVLQSEFSRVFVLVAFPLGAALLLVHRLLWSAWLRRRRAQGAYPVRILAVGSTATASDLAGELGRTPHVGAHVVGSCDSPTSVAAVAEQARALDVSLVVITTESRADPRYIEDLAWSLKGSGAHLAISTNVGVISSSRMEVVSLGSHPFVALAYPQLSLPKRLAKRCFDVVCSALGLLVLSPVLLALALAIRLDSPGAALYAQTRTGRDGEPFRMLKFRSMVTGADTMVTDLAHLDEGSGPMFKIPRDPRVTRIGRLLRRWSIDELPQLVNVLRGDMSLVGPRPALPTEVESYTDRDRRRLNVRPGLTGLWQVSGRADLPWEEGVGLDLSYVENWSLTGDLVILLRTVGAVVSHRGAY